MDGQEFFTLTEIGRGAAVERFDLELQKVLDNIQDPNTDPKKARSVFLKFTITPYPNTDPEKARSVVLKFTITPRNQDHRVRMVNKAADQHLDGYRELGMRAANAENELNRIRIQNATLTARVKELEEAIGYIFIMLTRIKAHSRERPYKSQTHHCDYRVLLEKIGQITEHIF